MTSHNALTLRVWERGAGLDQGVRHGGLRGRRRGGTQTPDRPRSGGNPAGGQLHIAWRTDDHIFMTGPSEFEYEGHLDAQTFRVVGG